MTISISGDGLIDRTAGTDMTGTNTNDDAAAGQIGEYVESVVSNVSAPTSNQYGDLTSISLTAGDWDVSCNATCVLNGATQTVMGAGIGTATGNSSTGLVVGDTFAENIPPTAAANISVSISPNRFSLSATTTLYLKMTATYSAGTPKFYGRISARRVR